MRKYCLTMLMTALAMVCAAQQNYKYILQHMEEYTDREALYVLQDYQHANPQKPHAYYLIANINYKLQANEHALVDYNEKARMLYDAKVCYGNCRAFLTNDKVNATQYPLVAEQYPKVNEDNTLAWIASKIDTIMLMQDRLDSLYEAYVTMANRYDECVQNFSSFMMKYTRRKDAQLMLDAQDMELLQALRNQAALLPADIERFQEHLAVMPVAGYEPVFSFRPIAYFRVEGLTCTDFLQNNIQLWDYVAWVDDFMQEHEKVTAIKQNLYAEHSALEAMNGVGEKQPRENTLVQNQIRQYDEDSPMADLIHYDYLINMMHDLQKRIAPSDTAIVTEDEWLGCLQLAERHMRVVEQCREMNTKIRTSLWSTEEDGEDLVAKKYGEFMANTDDLSWISNLLDDYDAACNKSERFLRKWLLSQTDMPREVQIGETKMASLNGDGLRIWEKLPQDMDE